MKHTKKLVTFILSLVVLCSIFVLTTPQDVQAAAKPKFSQTKKTFFLAKKSYYIDSLEILNVQKNATITNLKSSNSKVLTVDLSTSASDLKAKKRTVYVSLKGSGTATVSCTVKQNGKTYKIKTKVTVKVAAPFKYIKLQNKNVYKGKNHKLYDYTTDKSSVKVSYKLQKGWKVVRVYYNYHNTDKGTMSKNHSLKNGDKVPIKQSYSSVKIDVKNSKNEVYRYLIILNQE